ncbi:MAG: CHASE2 domain-containing protein [Alphaproteobacteria bacterium]
MLPALVGGAILAIAILLRAFDPAPVETVRLAAFDQMHRMAPRPLEPVPVRIVDIDEESLARIGQWPWPRSVLADLTRRLDRAGAASIAFDVLFAEPDRWSVAGAGRLADDPAIARALAQIPDPDRAFADALAATRAVLGVVLVADPSAATPGEKAGIAVVGEAPMRGIRGFAGIVRSVPPLAEAARGEGAINAVPDRDGVIRRLPVMLRVGDRLVPSLAAEAIRLAQGAAGYVVREDGAGGLLIRTGNLIVATDARGEVWPHFGEADAQRVPAWRVLDGSAGDAIGRSIVLVGSSAAGLKDLRTTALATAVAGLDVQAETVANLLLGMALVRPAWLPAAEIAFAVLLAALLLALALRAGIAAAGVAAAIGIAGIAAAAWLSFGERVLLDPTFPAATTVAVFAGLGTVAYRRAEAERRRIRNAFQRYLSPVLVERLAAAPDRLSLGGETRRLTVLFADIRHFTRRAESLDPQTLTGFVNAVMTPLSEEVLAEGGTVDKFLGDGVMAFWNAPLDAPDHALRACRAALAMIARLERLNASLAGAVPAAMLPVEVGIGIDTGDCCVGNFGSAERFDYSALGEAVNRAARFEGLSRGYGVPAVIGEATRAAAPGLAAIALEETVVRGGSRPVQVYALGGDEAMAGSTRFREFEEAYAALRAAIAGRDAALARSAIERCEALAPPALAGLVARAAEIAADLERSASDGAGRALRL